jgi:iron complex transport system substrate-binding protein
MTHIQRIVSFLPSATEMACALGLSDRLVGVTHECDYPPEVKSKSIVVRAALPIETMTQTEIDAVVSERMRNGDSLYEVDERLLRELAPDLILTQDLCQVCAPSGNEVSQALSQLAKKPEILWLTPNSLEQIFDNLRDLGEATGETAKASELIAEAQGRLSRIESITSNLTVRPRVFCMEWLDPVYCSGHWVPEMVRIAGGVDGLGQERGDSIRIEWREVMAWQPEVMIITPCGYDLEKTIEVSRVLCEFDSWRDLPAVQSGRVYAVDSNSYFARPGPRVVDGTELLAHLIHPALFDWNGDVTAFQQLAC